MSDPDRYAKYDNYPGPAPAAQWKAYAGHNAKRADDFRAQSGMQSGGGPTSATLRHAKYKPNFGGKHVK